MLNQIVSLYWARGRSFDRVEDATQFRWLIYSADPWSDPGWTIGVPHSTQAPGEARVWYDYASEAGNGPSAVPTAIGRQLSDGTTVQVWRTRNAQDRVTRELDAAGRDTLYVYAANGIDLLEVRTVTGGRDELLARGAPGDRWPHDTAWWGEHVSPQHRRAPRSVPAERLSVPASALSAGTG